MSLKKEVKVYKTTSGKAPFRDWRDALKDKIIRARIDRRLERLADGNYGDSKPVGEGVFEMRLQFGAGYRIYTSRGHFLRFLASHLRSIFNRKKHLQSGTMRMFFTIKSAPQLGAKNLKK